MAENFYVTFSEKNPPPPGEMTLDGYAVVEAANIWDAADAADVLFPTGYAMIFGDPYWWQHLDNYPAGEQMRVATGRAVVESLRDAPPPPPDVSGR